MFVMFNCSNLHMKITNNIFKNKKREPYDSLIIYNIQFKWKFMQAPQIVPNGMNAMLPYPNPNT